MLTPKRLCKFLKWWDEELQKARNMSRLCSGRKCISSRQEKAGLSCKAQMLNSSPRWPLADTSAHWSFISKDFGHLIIPYLLRIDKCVRKTCMHIYLRESKLNVWFRTLVCYTSTKCDPSAFALPRILGDSESQGNKECSCIWAPAVKALQIRGAPTHV